MINFLTSIRSAATTGVLHNLSSILNKDYRNPLRGMELTIFALLSCVFMIGFMSLYQPFGVHDYHFHHKLMLFTGFGLISAIVLIFTYQVVEVWFEKTHWKYWEVAFSIAVKIILIGICTAVYAGILEIAEINFSSLSWFTMVTAAVGIFPTASLLFFNKFRKSRYRRHFSYELLKNDRIITIHSENRKETIEIEANKLLFIQSCDNYCEIVLDDAGLKRKLIRNSLKAIHEETELPSLIRCHRSFLVNLAKVSEWRGNSQGLKLSLNDFQDLVPVSRSFTAKVRKKLSS